MREIKFRAWDESRKWFLIGDVKWLVKQFNEANTTFEESLVQQYTGLKDKNGKEIYEGDIMKSERGMCKAIFHDGAFIPQPFNYGSENRFMGMSNWHNEGEIEIIGNIYENSELLK